MKGHHAHRAHGFGVPQKRRTILYAALACAFGSGVLWLVFHYFLQRTGEFGPEPQALEIWWLRLHGASAFVLLWLGGTMWASHARPALKNEAPLRRSGLGVLAALVWLGASGYLLYYLADDDWTGVVRVLHWAVGLALALPLAVHLFVARAERRRRES